jgi:hypothetical protein
MYQAKKKTMFQYHKTHVTTIIMMTHGFRFHHVALLLILHSSNDRKIPMKLKGTPSHSISKMIVHLLSVYNNVCTMLPVKLEIRHPYCFER